MSLILAIEPDRRQVAQLTNIVGQCVGAELVVADTTERALESIGSRIPDLILVPALLSPQDDAALAAALRVIATAAHVQMLTIPTFATAKARPKSRGVLSAFRRSVKEAPLDGCDPGVFAEQISSYLERATEERANEERAAAQALDDDAHALAANRVSLAAQPLDEVPADVVTEPWTTALEPAPEPAFDEPVGTFEATFERTDSPVAVEEAPKTTETATARASVTRDEYAPVENIEVVEIIQPVEIVETVDHELAAKPEHTCPVISFTEEPPPPAMALDEFEATLHRTEQPSVAEVIAGPWTATAPIDADIEDRGNESVKIDTHVSTELEEAPPAVAIAVDPPVALALSEADAESALLAAFDLTELPVIHEVHTEQWMPADEPERDKDDDSEWDQVGIDLSTELEVVLHAEEPTERLEPEASLKPFEAEVPVERFERLPLAAWQSWPRLEGTASGADTNQGAESEAALQAPEPFERFEPVVPIRAFEPVPLAAWQSWPPLEGMAAEAYEEPIAPRAAVARPEWVELMRSLREDIARRRTELAQPVQAQVKRQRPRDKAAAAAPPPAQPPTKPVKRTRPIEDEWGLFDPEQCGFAALLDKLDEITGPSGSGPHTRRQA